MWARIAWCCDTILMCSSDHVLYLLSGRVEGKVHDVLFPLLDDSQISTPSLKHQSGIHIH